MAANSHNITAFSDGLRVTLFRRDYDNIGMYCDRVCIEKTYGHGKHRKTRAISLELEDFQTVCEVINAYLKSKK